LSDSVRAVICLMPPGVGNAELVVPLYAKVAVASLGCARTTLQAHVCLPDSLVLDQFLCCSVGDDVSFGHDTVCLLQPHPGWDEPHTVFRLITECRFP
jgi:hypothetical protein